MALLQWGSYQSDCFQVLHCALLLLLLCVVTHQGMIVVLYGSADYSRSLVLHLAQHPLVIFCCFDAVGSTSWKATTTYKSSPSLARQQRLVTVAEYSNVSTLYGTAVVFLNQGFNKCNKAFS
jgi:hypothetical protein